MREFWHSFLNFFVSLRLTIVLLALSIVLVIWATLAQVDIGVWGVQQRFFRTFFVLAHIPGTDIPVPVFPGGYFLGGLLFINLVVAHILRFKLTWRKSGIWLTHFGVILLLVGELMTSLWQKEYQMRLDVGQTKNYSESYHDDELAVIDTSNPRHDSVVAIPARLLARQHDIYSPRLPFRVVVKAYYPNADMQMRDQASNPAPTLATVGFGPRLAVFPQPVTYRENERNLPAAYIELIGPEGSLGTWLVSTQLGMPQTFTYDGRDWSLMLRFTRNYKPFSLTLLKFTHDIYPGTDIPKNFASTLRLTTPDGSVDRQVLIYMNHPLRYAGLTFYQAGYANNNKTTLLQVVRNPSWRLPYIACFLIALGLVIQFGLSLSRFFRRRSQTAAVKPGSQAS